MQNVTLDELHKCLLAFLDTNTLSNCCLDQSNKSIQLNAQDDSGETAFMSACQKGHKDVFKLLTNVPKH